MLDLHHERGESGIASLLVTFATGDQRCLADADRVTHAIGTGGPSLAGHRHEELVEAGFMRTDDSSDTDLDDIHVRVTSARRQVRRRCANAPELRNRRDGRSAKV